MNNGCSWPNRDPIGEIGGLNLYRFSLNAPLQYLDSDGMVPGAIGVGGGFAATLAIHIAQQYNNARCGQFAKADCESCCNRTAAALGVTCAAATVAGTLGSVAVTGTVPVVGTLIAPFVGILTGYSIAKQCGPEVSMGLWECKQNCTRCQDAPSAPPNLIPGDYYTDYGDRNAPPTLIIR